ncbi:MAG TPA: hypothetical protein VN456_05840 [Desulfosporosinus sp.]|nr:hypothetical protein [Desulfosporosinus sp.]
MRKYDWNVLSKYGAFKVHAKKHVQQKLLHPPQFSCEKCGGDMYPEYYKGLHGYEYKISDIQEQ